MTDWNSTWTTYANPNVTGFYEIMNYANSTTGDMFGSAIIIGIFAVFFMAFRRYGDDVAFASASFISMVISGIFRATGLIGDIFFLIFGLMTGVSIIILWRRQ